MIDNLNQLWGDFVWLKCEPQWVILFKQQNMGDFCVVKICNHNAVKFNLCPNNYYPVGDIIVIPIS